MSPFPAEPLNTASSGSVSGKWSAPVQPTPEPDTRGEVEALSRLRRSLEDVISEHAGHGYGGHMRPAGVGCETYVVAWSMLALLPEGTPIAPRTAPLPDAEEVGEKVAPKCHSEATQRTLTSETNDGGNSDGNEDERWPFGGDSEHDQGTRKERGEEPLPEVRSEISSEVSQRRPDVRDGLPVDRLRVRGDENAGLATPAPPVTVPEPEGGDEG